ncbi:MAG TPA: polysaccharide deacetylase family protein [Candidatus Hydrogenedentes bacterium]|nr:polysaccharide deacetylase family protein [Candidatus Hydrogenedentota bacterium]HOL77082.1 polysaccharide deacetylase family protein [Candidatus Hydrogenedentota bacterium]
MRYILATSILCLAVGSFADDATYAERLGWPRGSKVVIFHCDDAGMSHSSNRGAIEALEYGILTSVSTMMPCGWVPEFAAYLKKHPQTDNGLHLTLTSEWENYRWMPVAGRDAVPSLTDEQGCLWDNVGQVAQFGTPDDIEKEIRAQIARAERMGMPITHIDSHMGTLFAREDFFERYMKVGIEKNIPILMIGGHMTYTKKENAEAVEKIQGLAEKVWEAGLPVLDDLYTGTYDIEDFATKKKELIQVLKTLKPGVTQIIVHCTRPTEEFEKISSSGPKRLADLLVMLDPDVKKVIEEEKIILSTWRELKERRDKVGNNTSK